METSASLLDRLATEPDEGSWQRLDNLYRPLIRRWLLREANLRDDVDDLTQEVMSVLVRDLPNFRRQRLGSFRRWLRTITLHRLRNHLRARQARGSAGTLLDGCPLVEQLADPNSELSLRWDQEHNTHIVRRLLELLENDGRFAPTTLKAFRRLVFDEQSPSAVARELKLSLNAVFLAKSRVLKWLRQETAGLLD